MSSIALTPGELTSWIEFIHELTGIYLDNSKGYLIETRLGNIIRESGVNTFAALLVKVRSDISGAFKRKVIEAITTNETSFFRDNAPFEMLQYKIIPDIIDKKNRVGLKPLPIRIWSAACSTGQEAYSTAIILKELLGSFQGYDLRILGTDISDKAVAYASYASYSKLEIDRGMPSHYLNKYFSIVNNQWKIRDELRALATFRTINLMESFSFPNKFDIIFCRNVAIYFNETDKIRLFKNIGKNLAQDGYLIIGSTESITGLCPEFEPKRHIRSVYYQFKKGTI